jgi:hypothetical protein
MRRGAAAAVAYARADPASCVTGRIRTRGARNPVTDPMHKPHFLLVAPFPGMFIRRAAAYWVLVHLLRAIGMLWMAAIKELRITPEDLLPGGNPLVPALVVVLGMLQARRSDEDLYLANLGYGWPTIAAYLLVPAAALEVAATVGRLVWPAAAAYLALPPAGLGQAFAA